MDALDNLIFATLQSPLQGAPPTLISSDYLLPPAFAGFQPALITPAGVFNPVYSFTTFDKEAYSGYLDTNVIETSIMRHWHDLNGNGVPFSLAAGFQYFWPGLGVISDFTNSTTYNLFYSYLIENTRILQIFERLIETYLHNEELGNAPPIVRQWLLNSENLFFKDNTARSNNIRSLLRASYDANRRNAYYRMFGVDLAFGDINSTSGSNLSYHKSSTSNQQFIPLFEKYLSEIWQGYINARNTAGANTSDVNSIVDIAVQIQELLFARRGGQPGGLPVNHYASTNLSNEEFSSVILITWFTFIISQDTAVIQFLNCQSSTIGERLLKLGAKVGIPAHTKCQALFDMAGAASNIISLLETPGYLNSNVNVQTMLSSLNPTSPLSIDSDYMNSFLTVIHNWEKATGHQIKTPESNIRGTVTVAQPRSNGKVVTQSYT